MTLSDVHCACGDEHPALFDPGDEVVHAMHIVLKRGRPVTGRCLVCWSGYVPQPSPTVADA